MFGVIIVNLDSLSYMGIKEWCYSNFKYLQDLTMACVSCIKTLGFICQKLRNILMH